MKRNFLIGLAGVLLAFAMVGCDQGGGEEDEQHAEEGVTYVGATDEGTPVELFIEGDTYTVKAGEDVVSRGTATKTADGTWTLQPEGGGDSFTAKADGDGLTIEGPITDTLDGEDLHELYPVEKEPPADADADYRVSLSVAALHVFPAQTEGYEKADVETLTVTVTNGGSQKTGKLTVALSGTDSESFTQSKKTITNIAVDGTTTFTVRPALGLEAGTYNAKVTVSGGNGISASFNVRFTVNKADEPDDGDDEDPTDPDDEDPEDPNGEDEEPVYGISLDVSGTAFPDAVFGYEAQEPLEVTIRNTGNQPTGTLTLKVSSADFSVSRDAVGSIAVDKTETFRVRVNLGLAVGTHTAKVSVSGDNIEEQSFEVSFTVTATYGIELDADGEYTFEDAAFGYEPQEPLEVTIRNTGDQPTGSLTLSVSNGDFTLNKQAINTIGVNGTAEFTVVPNTGLAEGTHNALVTVSGGSNIEEQSFEVSFVVTRSVPQTLADLVTRMAEDKSLASASYILPSGNETYTTAVTLTAANSPATVVIDGGGRVITGGTNSITVGAGITFTLKNIKFTTLPLTVAAGGKLILGNEGDAAGSAVVQSNAGAGITVNGGTLELKAGALVKDNHASGIVLENGSHFTMTGGEISGNEVNDGGSFYGYGGGVLMKGANSVFTMDGGVIKENKAVASSLTITFYLGGGVAIIDGGTFTMIGGSISDNKAGHSGGGVYMEGDGGTFIMTGGSISENGMDSGGFGGGVYAEGDGVSFTLDGGVITGNKAAYGAGVWIGGEGTTFTMDSGAISGNNAIGGYGGGVRLNGGVSFTMNGGEISGNTTDGRGGGILMGGTTVLNMTGGDIKGNTAVLEGGGVRLGSTTELTGNPSIGAKDAGRGSIWGNTASTGPDVYDPSL